MIANGKIRLPQLMMNMVSLIGLTTAAFGFIASGTLLVLEMLAPVQSPYLGIFTFMVGPGIMMFGLFLAVLGAVLKRRRIRRAGMEPPMPVVDLNNRRHFTYAVTFLVIGLTFVSLSAVGSYRAFHFTESVEFCGVTCHSVMKPEHTAFQKSPHANVQCTTCHIGPGAGWFVKSKMSGLRQVVAVMRGSYSRPIETPVHNLRPARETCYTCHWPQKFFGSVALQRTYFRGDEANSPWTIAMLIKVGGGDREQGRAQGIHWHMVIDNTIEYIASDEKRMKIPWVRQTRSDGSVVVYKTKDPKAALTDEQIAKAEIRTMDCIDCHNRPTHQYRSPERSLNEAMGAGHIDTSLPNFKAKASELLTGEYTTETQALAAIRSGLLEEYPDAGPSLEKSIAAVETIFKYNFFPEMKVSWREYPDHIGHMDTPGCFRCHDGEHVSDDGKVITKDCNSCHTIIAQGPGTEIQQITSTGLEFQHPEDIDDEWKTTLCSDCHEGVPVQ